MTHECKYEERMNIIAEDIRDIKNDVRALLRFKWQLMGGSAAVGVIFTIVVTLIKLIK